MTCWPTRSRTRAQQKGDARKQSMLCWMRFYNRDWKPGDPLPLDTEAARRGVTIDHIMGGYTEIAKEMRKTEKQRDASFTASLKGAGQRARERLGCDASAQKRCRFYAACRRSL